MAVARCSLCSLAMTGPAWSTAGDGRRTAQAKNHVSSGGIAPARRTRALEIQFSARAIEARISYRISGAKYLPCAVPESASNVACRDYGRLNLSSPGRDYIFDTMSDESR